MLAKTPEMNFLKIRTPNSEIATLMKNYGLKNSTLGNITKSYSFAQNIFLFLKANGNPSYTNMQVIFVKIV